ncbi:hypothetical protein G6F68_021114 [Rhizopus microsporus]|nr:hypothetical protein G6F68_021114 [Rhizopus microsporus]
MRVFAETDQRRHRARVHAGETYASMQLAVLLANRSGPLTAIEWSQAWARAQDMAERFDATIEDLRRPGHPGRRDSDARRRSTGR